MGEEESEAGVVIIESQHECGRGRDEGRSERKGK